jgi:hypothetical protein
LRAAQAGNTRMPVWLCKQLLGHKDTSKVEQTGPDGAAIKHAVHLMLSESEREELKASWPATMGRSRPLNPPACAINPAERVRFRRPVERPDRGPCGSLPRLWQRQ